MNDKVENLPGRLTADTKLWINTNLERMQGFLDQLEER